MSRAPGLTTREKRVMAGVREGKTAGEIAADLGISEETVRTHYRHIRHKTGSRTIAQAVAVVERWERG